MNAKTLLLFLFCGLAARSTSFAADPTLGLATEAPHRAVGENQNYTQTIRGRVLGEQSQIPLPGVNVIVEGTNPVLGTATDIDGYYVIEDVPVGRVTVQFSFIGYETRTARNIEHIASKELVLNMSLRESTEQIMEVTVVEKQDLQRTKNERVEVSGRTFSIEESKCFAGANNDVARMASNFAGVQRTNDATNAIVIRGNSPIGLIWRMEGVDIPNPNHFGSLGATGGPVSMLNNNVLANSDFLTGAFPADYGDGLSGVFDLQMRNGNDQNHEFLGQIGFNGLELGAEGPISREDHSSYLINYRYSTLGIMADMGFEFGTGTAIPYYQDFSAKFNFPSRKVGNIEVFAMGGKSNIDFLDSENQDEEPDNFYSGNADLRNRVESGVIGVSHQYLFENDMYSQVTLAASAIRNKTTIDTLYGDGTQTALNYGQEFLETNLQLAAYLHKKIDAKNNVRVGTFITRMNFDLNDSIYDNGGDFFQTIRNHDGGDWRYQPYINWGHRFNNRLEMNAGVHSMFLQSNGRYNIEPRLGFGYQIDENNRISTGYGLHSQVPNALTIYKEVRLVDGSYASPNTDVDFQKSHHFVVGYDRRLPWGLNLKAEAYFQWIYDALVTPEQSEYSLLNDGSFTFFTPDTALNEGNGYNVGLDLTLEKYLENGFYFLSTLSLFESRYSGLDGEWRNTAFNGNFVYNLIGGKEFALRSKKENPRFLNTITLDSKFSWAGGQRYVPIDLAASNAAGEAVYDWSRAYEEQFIDYLRLDIRIGYKMARPNVTQEWALDIQNVTGRENPFGQNYNEATGEIEVTNQLGFFPMFLYRITF